MNCDCYINGLIGQAIVPLKVGFEACTCDWQTGFLRQPCAGGLVPLFLRVLDFSASHSPFCAFAW
jgi:hypothetical protein